MTKGYNTQLQALTKTLEHYPDTDEPIEALQQAAALTSQWVAASSETPDMIEAVSRLPALIAAILSNRRFASAKSLTLAGDILCNVTLLWPKLSSHKLFLEAFCLIADIEKPFYTLYQQEDYTWAVPPDGQPEDLYEWRSTLSVGSQVDAIKVDFQYGRKCWARATIQEIDEEQCFTLQFEAEGQEFNRVVSRDSCDIAPYHSKSENDDWRERLQEGSVVDAYDLRNSWRDSVVLAIRTRTNDCGSETTEAKVGIHEAAQQPEYHAFHDYSHEWISTRSPRLAQFRSMPRKERYYSGPVTLETLVDDSNDYLEVAPHAYCVTRLTGVRSQVLVKNLNRFGCAGLFEAALERMQDLEEPWSFEAFHAMATFLSAHYKSYHRQFARRFIPEFKTAVFHYLSECPDTVMRDFQREKIESIKTGLERMLGRIYLLQERGQLLDHFFVELALKFFRSPFLERRIHGLKSLSEHIRLCRHHSRKTLKLDELLQMVKTHSVLSHIFGPQGHPQLIKRSVDVLRLLAEQLELQTEDIDTIWAAALTDDEETKQCLYKVLIEASSSLKPSQVEVFVHRIAGMSPARLRKDELTLLYELTKFSTRVGIATTLACDFLFQITTENEAYPAPVVVFALERFTELMKSWDMRTARLGVITKCIQHIRENRAAIQCLRIMKKMILNLPQQSAYIDIPSRTSVIDKIVKHHAALPAIFNNLQHFKQIAGAAQADTIVCDRTPYTEQIEERLGILLVLLTESYPLVLSAEQMNTLWELLMQQASCEAERTVFLRWLAQLAQHQSQHLKVIEDQTMQQFFQEKLAIPTRDYTNLTLEEFLVFKRFFLLVNVHLKRVKTLVQYAGSPAVLSVSARRLGYQLIEPPGRLEGYHCLRKLLFEVDSATLFDSVQEFVFDLHENLLMTAYLSEVRQEFVQTCLAHLREGSVSVRYKALVLLKNIVSECNKAGTGSMKSHSSLLRGDVYVLSFNNQITYRVPDPEVPKSFELRVFSNSTLWELRRLVGKKVHCLNDQFRMTTGSVEVKDADNGKTLQELRFRPTEAFTLMRRYPSMSYAPLLTFNDQLTPRAREIFSGWFQRFADQGEKMSPEGCAAFTRSCTGDACQATDFHIQDIFRRYDFDNDGFLTLQDFLEFYQSACIYKHKVVWNDLMSHHYREDLKRFDDEDADYVDVELLPAFMITQDQANLDLFFTSLNCPELTEAAWELIVCLPTNPDLYHQVQTDWKAVVVPDSPYRLLYVLQILEAFVEKPQHEWVSNFLIDDGFKHLYELYMGLDYAEDQFRKGCATSLLRLLSLFILASFSAVSPDIYEVVELVRKNSEGVEEEPSNEPKTETPSMYRETEAYKALVQDLMALELADKIIEVVDFHQLVVRLIQVVAQVLGKSTHEPGDKTIIDSALELFISCVMHKNELLSTVYSLSDKDFLLQGLTFPQSISVRRAFAQSFKGICEKTSHAEHMPTPYFLHFLISQLPTAHNGLDYTQYFELVCDLIGFDTVSPSLDYREFLSTILEKLDAHPYNETTQTQSADNVLVGLLRIAERIFSCHPIFKDDYSSFVARLFEEYIFPPADAPSGNDEAPKAKTQDSRAAAYQLLNTLVRGSAERLRMLQSQLNELANRFVVVKSWTHLPSGDTRRSHGYVGIVNLGCICYMNTMLQQFYMIPEFRKGILAVDDGKPPTNLAYLQGDPSIDRTETGVDVDDNVLHQLQSLFAFLELSDRQAYNPSPFCFAFKDAGGQPMNISIQEDSQEFLNKILDKLENALKDTPSKTLTQSVFGGKFCSQIICKECQKVKENTDYFYNLSVDVKNSKTLHESLDKLIAADQISDYYCEHCEKSVEITKRTLLDELPNYLIVHLQRIVFSFDTLSNEKINTRLEFPHNLCVYDYTKAGATAKENEEEPPADLEDYEYELVGVTVQTGTAEMGHYYSFIRHRRSDGTADPQKWFEFNDSLVRDFE